MCARPLCSNTLAALQAPKNGGRLGPHTLRFHDNITESARARIRSGGNTSKGILGIFEYNIQFFMVERNKNAQVSINLGKIKSNLSYLEIDLPI